MTLVGGLAVALALVTIASALAWGRLRQRALLEARQEAARPLGEETSSEVSSGQPAGLSEGDPHATSSGATPIPEPEEPEAEESRDEPSALILRPRPATSGHRRWVLGLTAVAPLVTLGAWVHHRRFLGYHAYKGQVAVPSFSEWVSAELRGSAVLGYWHVAGLLPELPWKPKALEDSPQGRLVVCVHGYTQNATNFMGLERVLRSHGRPTRALSLGHRLAPMSWYAWRLEKQLREIARQHSDGFDVVAHSMGGVVLRMVLTEHEDLRPFLRTVVTLGSPHRGTAAARGIPLLPEVRALKRRSALLKNLPHLTDLLPHARIVTIAGDADTVVYPLDTALAPPAAKGRAQRVVLRGIGHAGLLTEPEAWRAVQTALAE